MQKEVLKHVKECANCRGKGWVRGVTGMRLYCYPCDGIGYLKANGDKADGLTLGREIYDLLNPKKVLPASSAGQVYVENTRGPCGSSYVGD